MPDKYGMLITTCDDGKKVFFVVNLDHVFEDEKEARAEMTRLNAEWRKEQNNG